MFLANILRLGLQLFCIGFFVYEVQNSFFKYWHPKIGTAVGTVQETEFDHPVYSICHAPADFGSYPTVENKSLLQLYQDLPPFEELVFRTQIAFNDPM